MSSSVQLQLALYYVCCLTASPLLAHQGCDVGVTVILSVGLQVGAVWELPGSVLFQG